MRISVTGTVALLAMSAMVLPLHAGVSISVSPWAAPSDFPDSPTIETTAASPAGATIAGGVAQGIPADNVLGQIFQTSSNVVLDAITVVGTLSSSTGDYTPYLFDLGTGTYNSYSSSLLDLSSYANMLGSLTFGLTFQTGTNFVKLDFTGTDQVTLIGNHSYAFALLAPSANANFNWQRSNGTTSYADGAGFQATSITGTATSSGMGGSVRNPYLAVYTLPVPEPTSITLMGLGLLATTFFIRRRK